MVNHEVKEVVFMFQLSHVTVKSVNAIYRVRCKEQTIARHAHRNVDILLLSLKGKVILQQGRRKRIVNQTNLGLLPHDTVYKIIVEEGSECILIEFVSEGLNLQRPDVFQLRDPVNIREKIIEAEKAWTRQSIGYTLQCYEVVYGALSDLSFGIAKVTAKAKKIDLIIPSIEYMEEHFADHRISNELMAKQSDISVVYFRKLFTSAYKVSPMKHVQNLRMSKAKELLQSGLMNVTEIAKVTGFSSIYSFSKTFKTSCGCSPMKYRPDNSDEE